MEQSIFLEKVYSKANEWRYCPIYTRIYLESFKGKEDEVIEYVKKETEKEIIETFKKDFEFLRAKHEIVPDLEFDNCVRLLSAYYFKKKKKRCSIGKKRNIKLWENK